MTSHHSLCEPLRPAALNSRNRGGREGTVSIDAAVPGARWEINVLGDGPIQIQVFHGDGVFHDRARL